MEPLSGVPRRPSGSAGGTKNFFRWTKPLSTTHTDVTVPHLAQDAPYGEVACRWYQAGITQGDQRGSFHGTSPITPGGDRRHLLPPGRPDRAGVTPFPVYRAECPPKRGGHSAPSRGGVEFWPAPRILPRSALDISPGSQYNSLWSLSGCSAVGSAHGSGP